MRKSFVLIACGLLLTPVFSFAQIQTQTPPPSSPQMQMPSGTIMPGTTPTSTGTVGTGVRMESKPPKPPKPMGPMTPPQVPSSTMPSSPQQSY